MRTRNALMVALVAQIAAVGAVAAQKPAAKPAAESQKAAAKSAEKATPPAVSSDSAKKVLMANANGATVKHERLHRKAQRMVYDFTYTQGTDKAEHHATVDAQTGEFKMAAAAKETAAAPSKSKSAAQSKPAPKKPGA